MGNKITELFIIRLIPPERPETICSVFLIKQGLVWSSWAGKPRWEQEVAGGRRVVAEGSVRSLGGRGWG